MKSVQKLWGKVYPTQVEKSIYVEGESLDAQCIMNAAHHEKKLIEHGGKNEERFCWYFGHLIFTIIIHFD